MGASLPFVASDGLAAMRPQPELAREPLVATSPDDVNLSTYVRPGMTAAHVLHDVAIEIDAAAIVVGSNHRGRLGRVLGDAVSTSLPHGAPCPVVVAPPRLRGRPRWVPPDRCRVRR
jgi:nucleotide-binding universal stress UspA family protein